MNTSLTSKICTPQLLRGVNKLTIRRGLSEIKPEVKPDASKSIKTHTEPAYVPPSSTLGDVHRVSNVEKYFLVWTKKFKSVKDVPGYVSRDMMEKSRNIIRIKTNLTIIVICLIGAVLAAKSGKKAVARGESVTQHNLDWHAEYNKTQNTQLAKPVAEN